MFVYNIGDEPLCSLCTRYSSAYGIRLVCRNDEYAACYTVSLDLKDGLLIANSPLTVEKEGVTAKVSVALRKGDSNP